MPIIGDSFAEHLLDKSTPPPEPGEPFEVLRDWVGHAGETQDWVQGLDFEWQGVGRDAKADLPGPYDINNQIHIKTATDFMLAPTNEIGSSSSERIEIAAWQLLNEIPTPLSQEIITLFQVLNTSNDNFLKINLVLETNGDIKLQGAHGKEGVSNFTLTNPNVMDKVNWTFWAVQFDHATTGGNTIRIDSGNDTVVEGRPDGNIASNTYDEIRFAEGPGLALPVANTLQIKISNIIGFRRTTDPPLTWRATVRTFTTQAQFDDFMWDTDNLTNTFWRCSEFDLGGGLGDRFIHGITGRYGIAKAPAGTLDRAVLSGPLDAGNSYDFSASCIATNSIFFTGDFQNWNMGLFVFFRQPVSVVNSDDWFFKIENGAGEFVQLERTTAAPWSLTWRASFASGPDMVQVTAASPLFNGSWHALTMTTGTTTDRWRVYIDAIQYFGGPASVPALSADMNKIQYGNIDVNLALMGVADYYDTDLDVGFFTETTEAGVIQYAQDATDDPGGLRFYSLMSRMQSQIVGDV